MLKRSLFLVVFGFAILALVASGCKKKPKSGAGAGGDNIGGVVGSDVYGEGLTGRPDSLTEVASQFSAVYFDYDSAQVNPAERSKLEAVAEYLRQNAGTSLIVEGNCDERGSNEYNLTLGERRALAVRAYLIGLGIDGNIIQTKSYGEERPVAVGHDEEAWRLNRRAEFALFK